MFELLNLKDGEYVLTLDPGHGGGEWGASYGNVIEKHLNLQTVLKMKKIIQEHCPEITAVLTRDSDVAISLSERGRIAKAAKSNFMLSVHFNSFDGAAKGSEIVYSRTSDYSKQVSEVMLDEVCKAVGTYKRRIFTKESTTYAGRNWYGVLRNSEPVPGLILEGLFIDNAGDIAILQSEGFIDKLAMAYVKSFCKAVGLKFVDKSLYGDWDSISDYAKIPVKEMHRLGIMSGDGKNFYPKSHITREDYATSLYNALKKFNLI